MLGNYISKDSLPGDLLGNLEAVTINAGSSFLAGKATSVFAPVANIGDNALLIKNTVTDPNLIKKISTDLIEHAVTVTTNELISYLSDKTTELLDFGKLTGVLAESVTYWTKEKLMTPAEILDLIKTKNVQEEQEKENKKNQEEGINNVKETISGTVGSLKDYVTNTINALDSGLSTITAYVTQGPDWVVTKVNSYVALGIEKAESFIGEQVNFVINVRDTTIDAIGQGIGSAAAEVVNKIAINAAKKLKADTEGLVSQTQTKAMNAITKAIMVVRQLTGIAIPPVYPKLPKITSLF